jgi:GT2 family glycosyltransferase
MHSFATASQVLRLYSKQLPGRAIRTWAQHGWRGVLARSVEAFSAHRPIDEFYTEWLRQFGGPTELGRAAMREDLSQWTAKPVISLIMPLHGADPRRLGAAVRSVRNQLYPHWELWVDDDNSMTAPVRERISTSAGTDSRIRIAPPHRRDEGTRDGVLALAAGDFIALIDCNDEIAEDALYWAAKELATHPQADMIFSDEDRIDAAGRRRDPSFKPDWNPSLMRGCNMFGRLGVLRKRLVENVGGLALGLGPGVAGGQIAGEGEHDLVLRCAQATSADRIRHIPRVLYHRGGEPGAADVRVCTPRRQADHALPAPAPRVSILVPSVCDVRLLEPCLTSLLTLTLYEPFEILLLVNERHRRQPEKSALIKRFAADPRLRVLAYPDRPFNYSWVNNWGARQAAGALLCFLNDDTSVITPDWLARLAARASLPGVAGAGPMLRYPDDSIQHAGVILGLSGVAGHACHGLPKGDCGYLDRACLEQDVSCLTAACLVMRKDVFLGVGGFDEALPIAFNDVDLCVRVRAAQWRLIWTPAAELYHHESTSVGRHDSPHRAAEFAHAVALMRKRWGPVLDADPYYNPNLSLRRAYHLAFPPRTAPIEIL